MSLGRIQVNITDTHGVPIPDLDVSAIALARINQPDEVEAVETTDASGTCYFDITEPCFYRPMLSTMLKRNIRVQILGAGGQGIRKPYVIDADGFGTHTTIQAAVTAALAGSENYVVIYINPGTYEENIACDFAGTGKHFFFVGEGCRERFVASNYNRVVKITEPGGSSDPVFTFDGDGWVQFYGLEISELSNGALELGDDITDTLYVRATNCKINGAITGVAASIYEAYFDDCILTHDNGRLMDVEGVEYTYINCYISAQGLVRTAWNRLHVINCDIHVSGTIGAGEFYIEDSSLVISGDTLIEGNEYASGGSGAGFLHYGGPNGDSQLTVNDNHIDLDEDEIGVELRQVGTATVVGNRIGGGGIAGGGTGVHVVKGVADPCTGVIVMGNAFYSIETGIDVDADATDGTCVFGPNAYTDTVGTETSGVDDAENYQVTVDDLFDGDASDLTYTPTDVTDWDGDADPGDADEALDQLAERITDVEDDYFLLAGRSGGQHAIGGLDSGDDLILESTAHATKGIVQVLDTMRIGRATGPDADTRNVVYIEHEHSGALGANTHRGMGIYVVYDPNGATTAYHTAMRFDAVLKAANAQDFTWLIGCIGSVKLGGSGTVEHARGLSGDISINEDNGQVVDEAVGVAAAASGITTYGSIGIAIGLYAQDVTTWAAAVGRAIGVRVNPQAGAGEYFGLLIEPQTAGDPLHPIWQPGTAGLNYLAAETNIPNLVGADVRFLGDSATELDVRRTFSDFTINVGGGTDGSMVVLPAEHTHAADADYEVEIDSAGTEDQESATFKWRVNAGAWTTGVPLWNSDYNALLPIDLQNGITIAFEYGDYVNGDGWTWTAIATGDQVSALLVDTTNCSVLSAGHAAIGADAAVSATGVLVVAEAYEGINAFAGLAFSIAKTLTDDSAAGTMGILGAVAIDDDGHDLTGDVWGCRITLTKAGAGTATLFAGLSIDGVVAAGTITTYRGIEIENPVDAGGAITNLVGIYIEALTWGDVINRAIWTVGGDHVLTGNVKVGANATPGYTLDVAGQLGLSSYIEFAEIAKPANPADGYGRLYMKNDDTLYWLATDGTEYDLTTPIDATYVVMALHGDLSDERVLTAGSGIALADGGAGGAATLALDDLTAQWTQGGAFDILLDAAAAGIRFGHAAGPRLNAAAAGDDLLLAGDFDVSGVVAIGSLAALDSRQGLRVLHATGDATVFAPAAGAYIRPTVDTTTQCFAYGLTGEIEWAGAGTSANSYVLGLGFNAIQNGTNLTWLHGVYVSLISYADKGTVSKSHGFEVAPNYQGNKPGTFRGLYVQGHAAMNIVHGVRVEDFTGTTIYLLEMGPATPYLRLIGGANPGANQTNLYLAEGVAPTLRRVEWVAAEDLEAGDKVMVLV